MRFLSYIESSGAQYIDTGFKPNNNTRLVIDVDLQNTALGAFIGARHAFQNNAFSMFASNVKFQNDFGAVYADVTMTTTGRHTIDKNKNVLSVDGVVKSTLTNSTFSCSYPIYLLSINNGGAAMTSYPTTAKIYSCQIYDNGVLVRDFVPAVNDNGGIGLYDKVNASFYGNAGTGAFIGGEPLNEMFSVNFTALTNDRTYYTRVYPMDPKGYAQSEIGTQVGVATPKA